jgi:hypothetical protein
MAVKRIGFFTFASLFSISCCCPFSTLSSLSSLVLEFVVYINIIWNNFLSLSPIFEPTNWGLIIGTKFSNPPSIYVWKKNLTRLWKLSARRQIKSPPLPLKYVRGSLDFWASRIIKCMFFSSFLGFLAHAFVFISLGKRPPLMCKSVTSLSVYMGLLISSVHMCIFVCSF